MTTSFKPEIHRALKALQALQAEIGEGISIQRLLILMVVAQRDPEGVDQHELGTVLEMDKTALSRSIGALMGSNGNLPPLLNSEVDPVRRTRRIIRLTTKGRQVIRKVFGEVKREADAQQVGSGSHSS